MRVLCCTIAAFSAIVFTTGLLCAEQAEARSPTKQVQPSQAEPVQAQPEPESTPSSAVAVALESTSAVPVATSTPMPQYAYGDPPVTLVGPCPCRERKLARKRRWLELSFGSAQKFFGQSVSDPTGIIRKRTIPVTTVSVFGEWLFHPYFSVMALFDLPLEPRSTLNDGQLQQEYVPPSISGGIRATAIQAYILEDTLVEGQFAALVGSTLADIGGDAVFPTLGWRLHLRDDKGLTLYAGTTFEFRLNRIALIYGVGHRF